MMTLEREDRARARGATIYATIDGYASTCDAFHRVQMAPDGIEIVRAMSKAIEKSGRAREEIGYVNFHGTSTVLNDAIESRCVRDVFGPHAEKLAGSSTKSMIGHPQGASGAAGIVTSALALQRQFLPPTINQFAPGPVLRPRLRAEHGPAREHRRRAVQLPRVWLEEQRGCHRARLAGREASSDGPCSTFSSSGQAQPARLLRQCSHGQGARAPDRSSVLSASQALWRHAEPGCPRSPPTARPRRGDPARGAAGGRHACDRGWCGDRSALSRAASRSCSPAGTTSTWCSSTPRSRPASIAASDVPRGRRCCPTTGERPQ